MSLFGGDLLDSMAENGQFKDDPRVTYRDHHIWCNFWVFRPVEECDMCRRLWAKYPYDENDMTDGGIALAAQHFPDAKPLL